MTSAVPPQDDDARARYEQWAGAVAWAAYNPDEAPVFQGPNARKRTAALMLAVSKYESGWSEIVLATGAERARLAKVGWNDGGRSWCYMQINLGKRGTANTYTRGWTGPELLDDPRKCAAVGLTVLRSSYGQCRSNPHLHRLAAYAGGACWRGLRASAARVALGDRWATVGGWTDEQLDPHLLRVSYDAR